jgi:Protein of unknown function (DUF4241)
MDARRPILLGVAIAVVIGTALLAALPRPPRVAVPQDSPHAPPRMTPADLYALFIDPSPARSFDMPVALSVDDAGVLFLPSGALVASDAFIMDASPFTLDVPAGRHLVSVLRSDFDDGDRRIAAAMVRFVAGEPVRWELALVPGQDRSVLGPDDIFGYGVDSGTGAFTSPEAVAELKAEASYTAFSDGLMAAMAGKAVTDPLTASVEVDPTTHANVVAFASGFGDGTYPSFAGIDRDGQVVVVLTDFGILDASKD